MSGERHQVVLTIEDVAVIAKPIQSVESPPHLSEDSPVLNLANLVRVRRDVELTQRGGQDLAELLRGGRAEMVDLDFQDAERN